MATSLNSTSSTPSRSKWNSTRFWSSSTELISSPTFTSYSLFPSAREPAVEEKFWASSMVLTISVVSSVFRSASALAVSSASARSLSCFVISERLFASSASLLLIWDVSAERRLSSSEICLFKEAMSLLLPPALLSAAASLERAAVRSDSS